MPRQSRGGQELKKEQTTEHYKAGSRTNTPKNSFHVALLLLQFQDDL